MEEKKELFCEKNGKLNYWHTILTGFGFLASSIAWAIYDPYITKILNHLLGNSSMVAQWSAKLNESLPFLARFAAAQGEDVNLVGGGITLVPLFIGIIMTFDNIFGVIFQPTFGKLSDRCHSRLGKRRPFIAFGAPVCAVLFALIPICALRGSLPVTMLCIILFVFVMSLWRAPVVALMPDLTPPALRSEGNAIINLMGGLGSLIGMIAGTIVTLVYTAVTGIEVNAANEERTYPYVFLIGSVVMIIGMLVVLMKVKEPDSRIAALAEQNMQMDAAARRAAEKEAKRREKAERRAQKLSGAERKSLIFMLMGLFFLFCGSNAIQTFFSLFAAEILHMETSQATILMAIFAVCSAAAALPAGKLGTKFGRKKTILMGVVIAVCAFIPCIFFNDSMEKIGLMIGFTVCFLVAGFGLVIINVNTLPMVTELAKGSNVGQYTGYYYVASMTAQAITPIVGGAILDHTGDDQKGLLFVYGIACIAVAFVTMFFTKHGDNRPERKKKVVEYFGEEE